MTAAVKSPAPATNPTARLPVGADVVLRVLEQADVEYCFGIPGGAILPIYDAIARGTSIRHVLARHEQGAGHMAEGYARASGRIGVTFATSGPGATNLVTPIANAKMDSTPLLCITGQVATTLIGTDAFQECDIVGVTRPLVKDSWLVTHVSEIAPVLRWALALAASGRPGPVLVDIPKDVQEAPATIPAPPAAGAAKPRAPEAHTIQLVARAIEAARRPVLYVGGGVINADASRELLALAETARVPVVTTLMAKGAIPESHPLCFGCPGMHGSVWANWALNASDLLIAVGARFDDRVTGRLEQFAPDATVAHYDVDPHEIGKLRHADLPVNGGLRDALALTTALLRAPAASDAWLERLRACRLDAPLRYAPAGESLKPQFVIERVAAAVRERREAIWTTGVGRHQMWAMQYVGCERPRTFITSGGHATMGFGLPAAIGARAARPDATVVCIDGDGSFQMTAQEIATAVAAGLPVIVVIVNDGGLGMVRQWQTMFYERRHESIDLSEPADLAQVARGFGANARTVRTAAQLDRALADALRTDQVWVLDVHVAAGENVYPMMRPGRSGLDMLEFEEPRADAAANPEQPLSQRTT